MNPEGTQPENAPTKNNNPGDLKYAGQQGASETPGGFADFPSPQDGYAGLLNDLQAKINKNPNESLEEFSSTYAPEDDGNDPAQYTVKLANQMGVSPTTNIGSLQPEIGKFADAVSNNEGYTPQNPVTQAASAVGNAVGSALQQPGVAPAAAVGAGALGGAALLAAPEEALGGLAEGAEGLIGGAVNGIKSLFGGSQQQAPEQNLAAPSPEQTALSSAENAPLPQATPPKPEQPMPSYSTPSEPSDLYNSLSSALGSTVGGQQVMQEGKNRNIDPVSVMEQSGVISALQPDENGDYDKEGAVNLLNGSIAQDKGFQKEVVNAMQTPTNLQDMRSVAHQEVDKAMADTGERSRGHKEVDRIFDDYFSELPKGTDSQGKPYVKSFSLSPARLQKKKELLSVSERDFAKPRHERDAAAHVKEAMRKRLSEIAQKEGVKGWDETNKRMEAHILAKKAIKKLPKKAKRDKGKELRKEITGALAGALIGKTVGNGLVGGLLGDIVSRRLGKKEYKKIGTREEQEAARKQSEKKPESLLTGGVKK